MTIDRLMHKTKPTSRPHELADTTHNLLVIVGREDLRDDAHGPAVSRAEVRAAGGVDDGAVGEVGVPAAEHEVARVLVDGIVVALEAEVGDAEE
jgi:hypothetical protein